MNERFLTKEECERAFATAEAEMIVWMTFLHAMDNGEFVLVDDANKEPLYRIVRQGFPVINHH